MIKTESIIVHILNKKDCSWDHYHRWYILRHEGLQLDIVPPPVFIQKCRERDNIRQNRRRKRDSTRSNGGRDCLCVAYSVGLRQKQWRVCWKVRVFGRKGERQHPTKSGGGVVSFLWGGGEAENLDIIYCFENSRTNGEQGCQLLLQLPRTLFCMCMQGHTHTQICNPASIARMPGDLVHSNKCVYVCVYARVWLHSGLAAWLCIHTCVCIYIYYTCIYIYVHIQMCEYIYSHAYCSVYLFTHKFM